MYEAIKALERYSRLTCALQEAIKLIERDEKADVDPSLEHAAALLEIVMSMACGAYSAAYDDMLKSKRAA